MPSTSVPTAYPQGLLQVVIPSLKSTAAPSLPPWVQPRAHPELTDITTEMTTCRQGKAATLGTQGTQVWKDRVAHF